MAKVASTLNDEKDVLIWGAEDVLFGCAVSEKLASKEMGCFKSV